MLAKSIIISTLTAFGSAAVIARNDVGGGEPGGSTGSPTPADCATRDDGNTSPKYCPGSLGLGITVPVDLCSLSKFPELPISPLRDTGLTFPVFFTNGY